MEYQEHEQRQSEEQQAVPPALLPSVLRRLGLGDAPTTRVEEQVAALRDEERRRGGTADRSAGDPTEAASWELLLAALRDPAWEVRAAAVWTLGTWGEHAPGEALFNALSDEDGSVRAAALRTLSGMSGRGALEQALRLLHDAQWQVRQAAVLTVGELGEQAHAASELLLVSITDENALVRETARTICEQVQPATLSVPFLAFDEASEESDGKQVPTVSEQPHSSSEAMETPLKEQTKLNGNLHQMQQRKEFPDGMASPFPADRSDSSVRKGQRSRALPPRSRLLNLFNGLAAVLVVGLIIAGALVLFAHRPSNGGSAPNASVPLSFQPLPSDCFFFQIQLAVRHCPHDPFTRLDVSGDIAGYTIALKQAYADANQVLIEYTVTKVANHQPNSTANIDWTLKTQNGITLRGGGSDLSPSLGVMGFDFEPATIMPTASTKTLSLRLLIHSINAPVASTKPVRPVTLDFSLPFHASRAVIMQQTVTVAGKRVTLTQGVATPSETRFYLYSKDVPLDQGNNFSLTDNGRNVNGLDGSVGGITNQDGYLTFDRNLSYTTWIVDFEALFDNQVVGVLTVSAPPGSHGGPWIFHFTVH